MQLNINTYSKKQGMQASLGNKNNRNCVGAINSQVPRSHHEAKRV